MNSGHLLGCSTVHTKIASTPASLLIPPHDSSLCQFRDILTMKYMCFYSMKRLCFYSTSLTLSKHCSKISASSSFLLWVILIALLLTNIRRQVKAAISSKVGPNPP